MRVLTVLTVTLSLAACYNLDTPKSTVRLVTSMTYPELPPLEPLPPLNLEPFKYDYPRDSSGNLIPNSNIFIGFTRENWQIFLLNQDKLAMNNKACVYRIEEVNRQRSEWQKLAQTEASKARTN